MTTEIDLLIEQVRNTPVRQEMVDGKKYKFHPLRSNIRYRLFRYRTTGDILTPGLIEHFEKQFRGGWDWDNFSYAWDISPTDPLKAIPEREWLTEGGLAIDSREGDVISAVRFHPNAFTRQAR